MQPERPIRRSRSPHRLLGAALIVLLAAGCASTPRFQGMTGEDLFAYGERALEEEEWSDAIAAFNRLVSAYPTFPFLPEARVNLAHAYFHNGEELTAASEYIRMLERFPGHPRAPEAALGVCRAYAEISPIPQRDQTYTRQAITNCDRLLRDYPQSAEAEEGREIRRSMVEKLARKTLMNGEYYFRNRLYDAAMIYFERVVNTYPETPAAPEALLLLVRSYERINWEEEAEEARERLLRLYPESEQAREVGREVDRANDGAVPGPA